VAQCRPGGRSAERITQNGNGLDVSDATFRYRRNRPEAHPGIGRIIGCVDGEEIKQASRCGCCEDGEQEETAKEVKDVAKPLLDIHCINRNGCKYPVAVKIAMDDGSVQTYTLDSMPSPNVVKATEILEQSIEISIGYQYRPKRRNRIHRGQR